MFLAEVITKTNRHLVVVKNATELELLVPDFIIYHCICQLNDIQLSQTIPGIILSSINWRI